MLDLFAGRLGWSKAFLARGWEVIAVDLVPSPGEHPKNLWFQKQDVLSLRCGLNGKFYFDTWGKNQPGFKADFICASPPCEEFSVHGMKHFHPNPKYPELGIKLFNHTRELCELALVPYVIENVRAAQQFVGKAVHHCGPFYLWGTGVPPILPQGIRKGLDMGWDKTTGKRTLHLGRRSSHNSKARAADKAITATVPPELANCVAEYAERLLAVSA